MDRRDIEFNAEGVTLRGWLYRGEGVSGRAPTVVMAHGFSAVKEMYLDAFAEVFAAAGLNALVFDNRNFGASDGEPRLEIDPWQQVRDYRHAITYATTLTRSTPLGSECGGAATPAGTCSWSARSTDAFGPWSRRCRWSAGPQTSASWCARTSGQASVRCSTPTARPGSSATHPRWSRWWRRTRSPLRRCRHPTRGPGSPRPARARAPSWRNEVTLRTVEMLGEYEPGVYIGRISPTPLLLVVARQDHLTPAHLALDAFERAREPKQLVILPGGHFDAYVDGFEGASTPARDFFVEHLG